MLEVRVKARGACESYIACFRGDVRRRIISWKCKLVVAGPILSWMGESCHDRKYCGALEETNNRHCALGINLLRQNLQLLPSLQIQLMRCVSLNLFYGQTRWLL
jgi:hypothetical protein